MTLGKLGKLKVVSFIALTIFAFCANIGYASIRKEQVLFTGQYLDIPWMGYRFSGPYWVQSDKTVTIEWVADRLVTVYVLNQKDYEQWPKIGGPLTYRTCKTAQQGRLEYYVNYADNFYIVVMGYAGTAARLYQWTEKLVWYENDTITEFPTFIIPFIAIPFLTLLVVILAKWKTKSVIKKFQSSLLYYCPQDFEA